MELAVITAKQVAVLFLLIFAGFACVSHDPRLSRGLV